MSPRKSLLTIGVAGAATTAAVAAILSIPARRLLDPVLVTTILAIGAGIGSAHLASRPITLRTALRFLGAFATGMLLATLAFAVHAHFASLDVQDPRHGVVWPLFAVMFLGTILLGLAAFVVGIFLTSVVFRHLDSNAKHLRPDA